MVRSGWYKATIPKQHTLNAKFFINDGTAGTPINGANASAEKVVTVLNEDAVVAPTPNPNPEPEPNPEPAPDPTPTPGTQPGSNYCRI